LQSFHSTVEMKFADIALLFQSCISFQYYNRHSNTKLSVHGFVL